MNTCAQSGGGGGNCRSRSGGQGIHFPSQFDGKDSAHYNPSFHIGRQAVPIPQAGRQVIVMRRVPAVHRVMIVVGVETIFVMVTIFVDVPSFVVVTSFAGFLPVMPPLDHGHVLRPGPKRNWQPNANMAATNTAKQVFSQINLSPNVVSADKPA